MSEEKKSTYNGYNESRKNSSLKYARENLKRIPLDVQKEQYLQIQAAAAAAGESVNGYIKGAIIQRMERDQGRAGSAPE
jgi:predicted HicB family RNase H-like nuclease